MALIWSREANGRRYEVRSAGRTRRLYTDGVFHSQYNPARPLTGSVWDLLWLPALMLAPGSVRRVLVLGVGGGAVVRQLQHFLTPEHIVGVELDPVHLYVARRFFGLRPGHAELHAADAVEFVEGYAGAPFDLIIDDLFAGRDGEPERAVAANRSWAHRLLRLLAPRGALVANFAGGKELRASALVRDRAVRRRFAAAFALSTPVDENAVGAFLRVHADSATLRQRVQARPGLDPRRSSGGLRYRIRRIDAPA